MFKTKKVSFNIQTTEQALAERKITQEDLKSAIEGLARIFGTNYHRFFPTEIRTKHINRILRVSGLLTNIEDLKGFKKHIKEYNKSSFDDHLFTARTADWLTANGYIVELEPSGTEEGGKRPDLSCINNAGVQIFLECKRIRTEKFYDLDEKKRFAELVYQKVQTCDQITVYLKNNSSAKLLEQRLEDKTFVSDIHKQGLLHADSSINVEGKFSINVIRKPAIVGAKSDFLTMVLVGLLEDTSNGERLPGCTILKGGRSIGVYGPPPDYSNIWNKKRRKSKKQKVPNYPFVVVICGEDVLGKPESHKGYFDRVWLTGENEECSGIGILSFVTSGENPQLQYFNNPSAQHPLPAKFFDPINISDKNG